MQVCANCTFLSHVPATVHRHNRKLHISIFSSTFFLVDYLSFIFSLLMALPAMVLLSPAAPGSQSRVVRITRAATRCPRRSAPSPLTSSVRRCPRRSAEQSRKVTIILSSSYPLTLSSHLIILLSYHNLILISYYCNICRS